MATNQRETVVVSRYWHHPQITVFIMREGIALQMDFEDVVRAIANEVGNPAMIFKKSTLEDRVLVASRSVIEKVKQASAET